MKPIAFISYVHEDQDFAVRLRDWVLEILPKSMEFFIAGDQGSIPLGTEWPAKVSAALRQCAVALLIVSPNSMNRKWIYFEAGAAVTRGVPVIPVCCKGMHKTELTPPLSFFQAVELPGYEGELALLRELARICRIEFPESVATLYDADRAGQGGMGTGLRPTHLRRPGSRCSVDIYYYDKGLTREQAVDIASRLSHQQIASRILEHDDLNGPDAVFIGALVEAEDARQVLALVPYPIRFLFRPDYPESEGGDAAGYKIGIGYSSAYNQGRRGARSEPVEVSCDQLNDLLDPRHTNASFHSLLRRLTRS